MIKTFLSGILLGVAAAVGLLLVIPVVDQHRETSIVSVAANGGNIESFHINIPMDRIMVGNPTAAVALPEGLEWPQHEILSDVLVELFKVRNSRDTVIGVASRTAALDAGENSSGDSAVDGDSSVDWVLHLPARGSIFIDMDSSPDESGARRGEFLAGSREFETLRGQVSERWVTDTSGADDAPDGRIELQASYVGTAEPIE